MLTRFDGIKVNRFGYRIADESAVQSVRRAGCRIPFWRLHLRGLQGEAFVDFPFSQHTHTHTNTHTNTGASSMYMYIGCCCCCWVDNEAAA